MSVNVAKLLETIHTLRSPGGCPWDRKQTLVDAVRHLLDEAGELLDAAVEDDAEHVTEELADLLFMICFSTEIHGETEGVDLDEVARVGNEKLIRRHPHVFGGDAAADTTESQKRWNAIKDQEKRDRGIDPDLISILKDLPASSSPLHQAYVYQDNAAAVGFDWPDTAGIWQKIDEEMSELREAAGDLETVSGQGSRDAAATAHRAVEHEVGDLLFSVVNLARRLEVQPDIALRRANQRFRRRFGHIEARFDHSRDALGEAGLDALEAAWQEAKALEADCD